MSVYNEKSSSMTLENKEILRLRDEHSGKRRERKGHRATRRIEDPVL